MTRSPDGLLALLLDGERLAVSRAITIVENGQAGAGTLLRGVAGHLGRALVVGITGPPGAGKSTLAGALAGALRQRGRSVGVIAVDPSNVAGRGAILGDRIRMHGHDEDVQVFVRSLAARGHPGGLSVATAAAADLLDAAGFDVVLIETVGTGQSETAVAGIADLKLVVTAPGLGDEIQALKSGVLEIADILVVNKADRDGSEDAAQQLRAGLALWPPHRPRPPLLLTVAMTGDGVPALLDAIEAAGETITADARTQRRRRHVRQMIADLAGRRIRDAILHAADGDIARICQSVLAGSLTLDAAALHAAVLAARESEPPLRAPDRADAMGP